MNKSYRTIWNEALGAWVAASENDAARGKPNKRGAIALVAMSFLAVVEPAFGQYTAGGG
ncbi:ESPR domain-containing protein, partial [Pseudomonas aeruginosa]